MAQKKPSFKDAEFNHAETTHSEQTEPLETVRTVIDETGSEKLQTSGDDTKGANDNGTTEETSEDRQNLDELAKDERGEYEDTDSSGARQDTATGQASDAVPPAGGQTQDKKHVARTVPKEVRGELKVEIQIIVEGLPEHGTFDAQRFAKDHNLALPLVRDIYMDASNDFVKHVKYKDKPEAKGLVISQKCNLMLKIEDFEGLNKGRDESERFKIGDGFEATSEGEKIILLRTSRAA